MRTSDDRPEQMVQSHTLALFGMSIQRAEMDFDFEIIKHQIQLATDEIGHATSEKQMYFLYTSKTELIMTAMGPLLDRTENDRFKENYDTLEREMKSCLAGYLTVDHGETGDSNEYTITMAGPVYGKETRSTDGSPPGSVQCSPKEYDRSMLLAEENLYRKMNCTARDHFRRALGLAFRVGMLNAADKVQIMRDKPMKNMSGVPNVR
jgi:hypothetical protein